MPSIQLCITPQHSCGKLDHHRAIDGETTNRTPCSLKISLRLTFVVVFLHSVAADKLRRHCAFPMIYNRKIGWPSLQQNRAPSALQLFKSPIRAKIATRLRIPRGCRCVLTKCPVPKRSKVINDRIDHCSDCCDSGLSRRGGDAQRSRYFLVDAADRMVDSSKTSNCSACC